MTAKQSRVTNSVGPGGPTFKLDDKKKSLCYAMEEVAYSKKYSGELLLCLPTTECGQG